MKRHIRAMALLGAGIIMGLMAPLAWGNFTSLARTGGNCQTFSQTGHKVCGRFLEYWQQHGGLAQQGYPLSEEFTETSDLNGKPYTVQYFERAVFEKHPENKAPNDVLLSQLGTILGREKYTKGFPDTAGVQPFYEDRTEPVNSLESCYNAINRNEYERAYSYFQGAPNPPASVVAPFQQFVQGYANTASVQLAVGKVTEDAGAGNLYASIPTVLQARHTDGSIQTFYGCYVMHRVNTGISLDPRDELWSINSAKLTEAKPNTSVDQLPAQPCSR